MSYSIAIGDIINSEQSERGANPRLSYQRRVERVPAARDITEALTEAEAYFHLIPTIPQIFHGLFLNSISCEANGIDGWIYTLTYTRRTGPRLGFLDYSGDSTGKTTQRTWSYRTVHAYAKEEDAKIPNNHHGINWNGEAFEGVEVPVPGYQWSETWGHPLTIMSNPYIAMCRRNTATFNEFAFRGFDPGEVLFRGITDSVDFFEEEDRFIPFWKITYHFEFSPNEDELMIGGENGIGPIVKHGHDYAWIAYSKEADDESKRVVGKPEFVYVEEVLKPFDFSLLGIGVGNISEIILGLSG